MTYDKSQSDFEREERNQAAMESGDDWKLLDRHSPRDGDQVEDGDRRIEQEDEDDCGL